MAVAIACICAACASDEADAEATGVYNSLSEWGLFRDLPSLTPADGVVPYEVNSPLFSDHMAKYRFIYLPKGEQVTYRAHEQPWELPVGAILVKTFAYPPESSANGEAQRILETRLMIHTPSGWEPEVYVWSDDQSDAERVVSGKRISLEAPAADNGGHSYFYDVPTRSECRKCHGAIEPVNGAQATRPLGATTLQLEREVDYGAGPESQIGHLEALGLLRGVTHSQREAYVDPMDERASLTERARAYLATNCANCHAADGEALDKSLWLDFASTAPDQDPYRYGVCKMPTSAGNADCDAVVDIVPGDPDNSLMVCRMELVGKGQMPPLGRNLVHRQGVELVRAWIAELDAADCFGGSE